jgi:hypothetical protein
MSSKCYIYLLLISVISCQENSTRNPIDTLSKTIKQDSITKIDIIYKPSFNNHSILHLDRITGIGWFWVDTTTMTWGHRAPHSISFSINEIETRTSIEKFWDSHFIKSLIPDSSLRGWTDGMPVEVFALNNGIKDSTHLGNVHSKRVDSTLLEQLEFIRSYSKDKAMKEYIKQVKLYLF